MTKLHIFSVNRTLVDLDCNVSWKEFLVKEGLSTADAAARAAEFQQAIAAGTVNAAEFARFQLEEFIGKTKPEVTRISTRHFEENVKPAVRQTAFDYVKQLIRQGENVAIITAIDTANAYSVALFFGISDFIANGSVLENDIFTGIPADTCPQGNGKVFQLGRICERYNITPAEVAVYSANADDIILMQSVGTPVAVSPDAALREYAEKANWQIVDWA